MKQNKNYTLYKILFLLFFSFNSIYSSYREYRLAANLPAGNSAYSFGLLQFKALETSEKLPGLYGYLDFDTEALYLESGLAPWGQHQLPRLGIRTKTHAFDWQNLLYIIEPTTGKPQSKQALQASYLGADIFAGLSYLSWVTRLGVGTEVSRLAPSEPSSGFVTSYPFWTYFYTLSGYYHQYPYLPDFPLGNSFLISYTVYNLVDGKGPGVPFFLAPNFREGSLIYKTAFFLPGILLKLEQRLVLFSFAAPGKTVDLIRASSLGGPETAYGRLAGFAFSEYRAPAFSLTNLDLLAPVTKKLYLWFISDILLTDRLFAGQKIHVGSGAGIYYLFTTGLPETTSRKAFFLRFDRTHTAQRQYEQDRWQAFVGFSGFSF